MTDRIMKAGVMALLLLLPLYFLGHARPEPGTGASWRRLIQSTDRGLALDEEVREAMPYAMELQQLGLDIRLAAGNREQNGIYIREERLMRVIDPPDLVRMGQNTDVILEFARAFDDSGEGKNTYLAILPTVAGLVGEDLPGFAGSRMVDQQRQIEEIYNQLSSIVRTADVLYTLQNQRDRYLYYRTDSNLTGTGGYYAYTAIAARMGLESLPLSRFDIDYLGEPYYGDLYSGTGQEEARPTAPYRKVMPDQILLYRYRGNRQYLLRQSVQGEERTYHTLYPLHRGQLGAPLDVYMGGAAAVTHIHTSAVHADHLAGPEDRTDRLLVLGDGASLPALPFLANHFRQVTVVNLYSAGEEDLAALRPQDYDSVLFVYGIETFTQTNQPALAGRISWE